MFRRLPRILAVVGWLAAGCSGQGRAGDSAEYPGDAASQDLAVPGEAGDTALADVAVDGPGDSPAGADVSVTDAPTGDVASPGGFLSACESNTDCESGFCVMDQGAKVCTRTCLGGCPDGWECGQVLGTGGDLTYVCTSRFWALCRPCEQDADCATAGQAVPCVVYGPDGRFCGTPCSSDAACPDGYDCQDSTSASGQFSKQCVLRQGECRCTPLFVTAALATTCQATNSHGTCAGHRYCQVDGKLGACDAAIPAPEACNRVDDDCNGKTDDGLARCCECGNGICENRPGADDGACGETLESCPYDCKVCGDGTCSPSESVSSCPEDCCGGCGDGKCRGYACGENAETCPQDCSTPCGNGECEKGETPFNCAEDCQWKECGNHTCEGGEGLDGPRPCAADCDEYCGNCDCDNGEDFTSCPTDCGYCGDGVCSPCPKLNESLANCWTDCCIPSAEVCNQLDDDCDGRTDQEGAVGCTHWYKDADGDGYGVSAEKRCLCGSEGAWTATQGGDCDDGEVGMHPGVAESCNHKDDDCNAITDDEGAAGCTTFWRDEDGDGFGVETDWRCLCVADGKHSARKLGDCLDSDPTVNPGATEVCNGKDDDCDGPTDEDLGATTCGRGACLHAVENCVLGVPQACDPLAGMQPESCNGTDDDCDGSVDEDLGATACGQGICFHTVENCANGLPQVCDPREGAAPEACNGLDDDCDGTTDGENASECEPWYRDADQDTWGNPSDWKCLCAATGQYSTRLAGDCDDEDPMNANQCRIAGVCVGKGASNPADPCRVCLPAITWQDWTDAADWTPCGSGGACLAKSCFTCPTGFVVVKPGTFSMGSPADEPGRLDDETPVHEVTLTRGYCLKSTEVTQSEWLGLMGTAPSYFSSCGPACPVERMSWFEAVAYCNALSAREGLPPCYALTECSGTLGGSCGSTETWCYGDYACKGVSFAGPSCTGYRLPTEAEWEYAARAGTGTATYNGTATLTDCTEPNAVLDPIAWFKGNSCLVPPDPTCAGGSSCSVHPAKGKRANGWSLYDMLGNVREWTWDEFGKYPLDPVTDPTGAVTAPRIRVYRGGGHSSSANACRAAARTIYHPASMRSADIGLRVARTIP